MEEVDEAPAAGVCFEVCLFGDKQCSEWLAVADGGVRFDHLAGEAGYLQVMRKSVKQRCRSGLRKLYWRLGAEVQRCDDVFDELLIVLRNYATGVAGFVFKVRIGDGKRHVHR